MAFGDVSPGKRANKLPADAAGRLGVSPNSGGDLMEGTTMWPAPPPAEVAGDETEGTTMRKSSRPSRGTGGGTQSSTNKMEGTTMRRSSQPGRGNTGGGTQSSSTKRHKQRFCASYPDVAQCRRGASCAFAHSREEARTHLLTVEQEKQEPSALTKDFFMYKFKTLWCPIGVQHDWQTCVYAHNYQDARRQVCIGYGPRPCPFWAKKDVVSDYAQRCPHGLRCPYSHGAKEQLYHPQYFRTIICRDLRAANKVCPRQKLCAFFHKRNERRKAPVDGTDYGALLPEEALPEAWVSEFLAPPFRDVPSAPEADSAWPASESPVPRIVSTAADGGLVFEFDKGLDMNEYWAAAIAATWGQDQKLLKSALEDYHFANAFSRPVRPSGEKMTYKKTDITPGSQFGDSDAAPDDSLSTSRVKLQVAGTGRNPQIISRGSHRGSSAVQGASGAMGSISPSTRCSSGPVEDADSEPWKVQVSYSYDPFAGSSFPGFLGNPPDGGDSADRSRPFEMDCFM